MSDTNKTQWQSGHAFDAESCRHTMNGFTSVLHCHHYATLYAQLADDADFIDGKALLRRSAEMTFHTVLAGYFREHGIEDHEQRAALAADYWRFTGMGKLRFERVGPTSSVAVMERSHVDEGWIKKWGKRDAPVNFIGQGYLAAVQAAIFDQPEGTCQVTETQSIVAGAETSRFVLVRK